MFTNIDKNTSEENVHLHKDTVLFLKTFLGYGYVSEAQSRLKRKQIYMSDGMIRQIKGGAKIDWPVLEVLTEIAKENQKAKSRIASLVND